jgi:hypothetical protein
MPRGGCVGQRRTANRQAPRFSALGTHRPVRSVVSAGPASGCSGGAAVWLDAVLAEQVVQAAEFATQPLLTGKHLLFPVAQRRGGLDVSRGERGLLLLLRPGKLVRSVREVSQDRLLDDPGLRICWPAASGQQFDHPFPDQGLAGGCTGQHLGTDAEAGTDCPARGTA